MELQGAGGGILCKMPQQLHEDDAARNVVVNAGGEIDAVIMGAQRDDLLRVLGAGDDGAHVLRGAVIIFGLYLQLEGLCPTAHQFGGVGSPHVQGHIVAKGLGEGLPQLADVAIGVAQAVDGGAREGQNGGGPGLLQLFVIGTAQAAVHQDDLALAALQMKGQQAFGIVQLALQAALGGGLGALITGDLVFFFIRSGDGELCLVDPAAGNGKRLQMGLYTAGAGLFQQTLGGLLFFGRAADLFIGQFFQQVECAVSRNRHGGFLL